MKYFRCRSNLVAATLLAFLFTSLASAVLPSRTWVSHAGSDSNVCSESSPCATFAGALPQTAAGGEINCLDTGDFGNGSALNITKAITIDCGGTFGSILVPSSSSGVAINAGAGDVVTLRNLSISSASGNNGILYFTAKAVHVENVRISVSGGGLCLQVATSAASLLTVDNATLTDCNTGIFASTTGGTAVVNVNNTRITNVGSFGVQADNGSRVTVRDSTIYFNNTGIIQTNNSGTGLGSTVTVINSTLGFSSNAALQSLSGDFMLAFGNSFVNDVLVYNPNGGQIFTGSDNINSGSVTGTANGGSSPKI